MDPLIIPLAAIVLPLSIPIIAILSKNGKRSRRDTQKLFKELETLKSENLQLKQRLENIETIVTEPDYDLRKTLKASDDQNHKLLD
ncbi:hypothetical protein [Flammeovirga aprica]|uniref:Phage shock protein B n=1 Tax=Flammeovirga aprica JL-4 TaxID=694437 RepID=A0A7X9RZH3_9BACT|nr:hypothetical protein [Flammeovirga aprica]NME71467.1 hypothetical protein [Flammeovirga aprica JL-4]